MTRTAILAVLCQLVIHGSTQEAPDCSHFNIDNLPHPRFLVLGPTGVGKSTLANQLLGRNPRNTTQTLFSVGDGLDSHTLDITWQVGNWLGDGPCFTIIDTPGTSDSEDRDYQHALLIANIMKDEIKSVDIFLLCFNGEEARFDQSIVSLLKLYESIFSKEMWKHAITEVTYWSHSEEDVYKRDRNKNTNELTRHKDWNAQYKDELMVSIEIPSVYIDPVLPVFSDDPQDQKYMETREIEAFKKYTALLLKHGENSPEFFCEGNCNSPNGYFLGNPWIKTKNITEKKGEKTVITCQIWNGIQGKASNNVSWTHNGEIIYNKTTKPYEKEPKIVTTDMWSGKVIFSENKSPGGGHYSDFVVTFKTLEESMEGNFTCENGMITDKNFAQVFMKVDGTWGEWGEWSQCSKSCLDLDNKMGLKKRERIPIPPRNGGNPVDPLDGKDMDACAGENGPENPVQCPVDFSWNPWSNWTECSPRCGDGITYRVRSCNEGSNGGALCPLADEENLSQKEENPCKIKDCPDCILLGWQEWSTCTKTCISNSSPGIRTRKRTTEEADPNNPQCIPADHSQKESCNTINCPIDGVIGQWTDWSPTDKICSSYCNSKTRPTPTQTKIRSCIAPLFEGNPCPPFKKQETRECPNKVQCPIDCQWGNWQNWSECSRKCGKGTKRRRKSVEVSAKFGGKKCSNSEIFEEGTCFLQQCPDCATGEWSSWGNCPSDCGQHVQTRKRKWKNPANFDILGGTSENCAAKAEQTDQKICNIICKGKCFAKIM